MVDDRAAEEVIYAGERWSTDRPIDAVPHGDGYGATISAGALAGKWSEDARVSRRWVTEGG